MQEKSTQKRDYVLIGGFAVWIAATTLMMLHNGEQTFARATTSGMGPLRAFVEAGLTVLTIEVTGLYFLYAATKADITPAQRRVAGWSVGLSVALGVAINLLGGIAGTGDVLNILARGAQGVCLGLIARWHWVGHQGEDLAGLVAQLKRQIQQLQNDLAAAVHQNGEVVASNAQLAAQIEALHAQLETQQDARDGEIARLHAEHAQLMRERAQRPAVQLAKRTPQLVSGMTWEQAVQHIQTQGLDVTVARLAEVTGKNKSTASRWLAKQGGRDV